MSSAVLVLLLVAGAALALFVAVRLPPKRATLDALKINGSFHGLILFGKNDAYVGLDQRQLGERILFKKRCGVDDDWALEVAITGPNLPASLTGELDSALNALGKRFKVESIPTERGDQIRFLLTGTAIKDPLALESATRIITRRLGHPRDSKYRIRFEGPKDYEAVNKYFGFKA